MNAEQEIRGNQNVQIQHVTGSSISISYQGGPNRIVPLEPALVPVPRTVRSPARLLRARSGVVPYTGREELRASLNRWCHSDEPLLTYVVGGGGGSGKTRLGTQMCVDLKDLNWLCGLLVATADQGGLDALVEAPTARLVVVDYAETRGEQLAYLLPPLAEQATEQHPVRVLLLVRSAPRRGDDWTESLQGHSDALDGLVDEMEVVVLDDRTLALQQADREDLFSAAADAFAARLPEPRPAHETPDLSQGLYANPLLVVVAAYLSLHTAERLPTSRQGLLEELVRHEDRYWQRTSGHLQADETLRRRVVALATLAGARKEQEAVGLLRLVPDLADSTTERRSQLARWVAGLYPGSEWWNPLEPDLLGEHLVATTLQDNPGALGGVLVDRPAEALARPLEVYTRAAPDHPELAGALSPVISERVAELCQLAVGQVARTVGLDEALAPTTLAAGLGRLGAVVPIDGDALPHALATIPQSRDQALSPLGAALTQQLVDHLRTDQPGMSDEERLANLAWALGHLSYYQFAVGRRDDALVATSEALALQRDLAEVQPSEHLADLARSLSNLSVYSWSMGRSSALSASEESVILRRQLSEADPALRHVLARSLSNHGAYLGDIGRNDDALAASREAVELFRALNGAESGSGPADLAAASNNLARALGAVGQWEDAVAAGQEAVALYRQLADDRPAIYGPDLAKALNNLSVGQAELGRRADATALLGEAIEIYRRVSETNPSSFLPDLSRALRNLAVDLRELDQLDESLAAAEEAVVLDTQVCVTRAERHLGTLAKSLVTLAETLSLLDRPDDAAVVYDEAESTIQRFVDLGDIDAVD